MRARLWTALARSLAFGAWTTGAVLVLLVLGMVRARSESTLGDVLLSLPMAVVVLAWAAGPLVLRFRGRAGPAAARPDR